MSGFDFEGLGRPAVGGSLGALERRPEIVLAKARLVDDEISLAVFLGFRMPYKSVSDAIWARLKMLRLPTSCGGALTRLRRPLATSESAPPTDLTSQIKIYYTPDKKTCSTFCNKLSLSTLPANWKNELLPRTCLGPVRFMLRSSVFVFSIAVAGQC